MTQDTALAMGDPNCDADVFSALWAAVPLLPQLPKDAPQEIRRLTIEVEDPERVYSIYRASRRHNFQILVERYVRSRTDCSTTSEFIDLAIDTSYSYVTAANPLAAVLRLVLLAANV
jgi:hypothetical protein